MGQLRAKWEGREEEDWGGEGKRMGELICSEGHAMTSAMVYSPIEAIMI